MPVEALADALYQQAHGLARNGGETLDAKYVVTLHQLAEGLEQRSFLHLGEIDVEGVELVVVVVLVAFVVVVGRPAVDVQLGLGVESQQDRQRQLAPARLDDLHRRRQLPGDLRADPRQGLGVELVGLVQDHQVGTGQLVLEQFVQRRFMVEVGVLAALLVHLLGMGGEGTGRHRRAVDHGDHRVDRAGVADFRPLESLHQRLGQGQAAGLDEDLVKVAAARHQLAHHREELFLHGAAQATVGQLENAALRLFFAAADGTLLEDLAVDAEFAELVDDHRDAPAFGVVQHVPEQGGLAGAEEAGDDGDGEFRQGFHGQPLFSSAGMRTSGADAGAAQRIRHRITPPGCMEVLSPGIAPRDRRGRSPGSRSGVSAGSPPSRVTQWHWGTIAVHSCGGSRGIDRVPS